METLSDIIRRLLEIRGVESRDFESFLHPSLADLASPDELPGVAQAADVALSALSAGRRIVVFGDYDCDGICATAILVKALRALPGGDKVVPFIPERLAEGYGMSDASVARCLGENPDVSLVITVDNGINSLRQIAELKERGVSVVVTDHHLASRSDENDEHLLPCSDVVVNPRVRAPDLLADLCGAGVAFFLANKIVSEARRRGMYSGPNVGGPLLVLAGLATVTDIMPLIGQNRILVSEALRRFHSLAPIGLRELYARAARSGCDKMSSRDFGFVLGPRINAAGRLKSGMESLELVLACDREIARELARIVDGYNTDRKSIEQKMTDDAMNKVVPDAAAQVIDLPDGHPGVAGIVASRVLERLDFKVPVCVIADGRGSARSPEGLNIRDAFVACDEFLERYGGHAAACGFSVKDGMTDAFRKALCDYCANASAGIRQVSDGMPEMWIKPEDLTVELADMLAELEPFGEKNPEPVFGIRDVRVEDIRQLGSEGRHLSFAVCRQTGSGSSKNRLRAVWWNHGDMVEELRAEGGSPHEIVFNLIASDYGERHPELKVVRID